MQLTEWIEDFFNLTNCRNKIKELRNATRCAVIKLYNEHYQIAETK